MPTTAATQESEVDPLRSLIREHRGNLSAIAKAMGISRQAVTRRIDAAKLARVAARARVAAGVTGPRAKSAKNEHDDRHRRKMLRALGNAASDDEARQALGMSRRSFYRAKAALGITADEIRDARAERQPSR